MYVVAMYVFTGTANRSDSTGRPNQQAHCDQAHARAGDSVCTFPLSAFFSLAGGSLVRHAHNAGDRAREACVSRAHTGMHITHRNAHQNSAAASVSPRWLPRPALRLPQQVLSLARWRRSCSIACHRAECRVACHYAAAHVCACPASMCATWPYCTQTNCTKANTSPHGRLTSCVTFATALPAQHSQHTHTRTCDHPRVLAHRSRATARHTLPRKLSHHLFTRACMQGQPPALRAVHCAVKLAAGRVASRHCAYVLGPAGGHAAHLLQLTCCSSSSWCRTWRCEQRRRQRSRRRCRQ